MVSIIGPRAGKTPRRAENSKTQERIPAVPFKDQSVIITLKAEKPTKAEVKEWLSVQIPYPNLAENDDIAQRAATYAEQQVLYYNQRTYELRDKWRALDSILRGTSLSRRFAQSDIHVPELYKMVESGVPRLEEAIFGLGVGQPWFNVLGRDEMDKKKAWRIRAWLDYLLDNAEFDGMHQEIIRCMLVYGFFAVKSWWDIDFIRKVERKSEKLPPDKKGNMRVKVTATEKEQLHYYGPRYKLVDPYDFIVDTQCTNAQKGMFVGDVGEVTIEELRAEEALGLVTNLDKLEEAPPKRYDGTERAWSKFQRSLTSQNEIYDERKAEGQSGKLQSVEVWAKWDPYGTGEAEEYKIRTVNGVAVDIRKNHHDDRHRPYAVGRAAREPFDFHNVGPLDHAVRSNIEIDEHRNLALKAHENSLCPIVFTRADATELPPNIFDVDPGEVIPVSEAPTFFSAPPVAHIMQLMDSVTRRDIEEITGFPRVYEGTGDTDATATGTLRKIEEANRRIKSLIRSLAFGYGEILKHTYSLSSQFTTRRETFRVMGADATKLGSHSELETADLNMELDFEIVGLASIHTLGLRGTAISTFFTQVYPIVANFIDPQSIDWMKLLQIQWDNTVGIVQGESIFKSEPGLDDLLSPQEENLMLSQGVEVPVQEADNDQEHMAGHSALAQGGVPTEAAGEVLLKHMAAHHKQGQMKQKKEQQRQEMARRREIATGGGGGAGAELPVGQEGRGPGREPDLNGQSQSQTPPGETPGPPRSQTAGSGDRATAIPQSANR